MASAITDQEFESNVLKSEMPVLVDFWATWCGPCRMMAPVLESLSEKYKTSLTVYKMDTDANPTTPQKYEVSGIPCCILFKNGKEIARIVGYRSEDAFVEELEKHISL